MTIVKLYKNILVLILIINCHMVMSQTKFVQYQDFEIAFNEKPDLKSLSNDFDLLFVLLLDSSNRQEFFKYNQELVELYRGYSCGLQLNMSTVGFVTQITDIKDIFRSDSLMSKVFSCVFDLQTQKITKQIINFPIYLKHNTAIVEISTGNSSDVYYFRLHEGVVQINWLGGTID